MAQRTEGDERSDDAQHVAPADAFGVLGNETRVDVLRALARLDDPVPYAELRRAVAYGGSGNFNYHLDRLVGRFVRKTDEGYALRRAGEAVARLLVAGTLTERPSVREGPADTRCGNCGERLAVRSERGAVRVRCETCDPVGVDAGSPSRGVRCEAGVVGVGDRDATGADAAEVLHGAHLATLLEGVCPACGGGVSLGYSTCEGHDGAGTQRCGVCNAGAAALATAACERCPVQKRFAPRLATLYDGAVVAFLQRNGVDVSVPVRVLSGDVAAVVGEMESRRVGTDPHRFRVAVPAGDRRLRVALDETLDVTVLERPAVADD